MDLYLNPAKITEIIGVEEEIINRSLERRDVDIEPYLRVVSAPPKNPGERPKPQIELRIDGLALLIKKLTYNIPTDDIIENLSCQIFHITHLRETCEKLEEENRALIAENEQLRESIGVFQTEKENLSSELDELQRQLIAEQSKTWIARLLKRGN